MIKLEFSTFLLTGWDFQYRMADAMKSLLVGCLLLAATGKPYEGYAVKVQSTSVNPNGVRFIETSQIVTEGVPKRLTFTCNEGVASCSTPAVDGRYTVSTRGQAYKCDNYALCPESGGLCIRVCLKDVY